MYDREIKIARKAIKKLTKIILSEDKEKFDNLNDLVKNKEIECEKLFIELIAKKFPKDKILSEKLNSSSNLQDRTWLIDSIDGRINYARELPIFGTQIAFYDRNETQFAFIFLPKLNELYFAKNGNGCYLNGKQIVIERDVELNDTLVAMSDFHHMPSSISEKQLELYKNIFSKILGFRTNGCSSFDFAQVANSNYACHIFIGQKLWNYLPGMLICKEAGAICNSGEFYGNTYHMACCNDNLSKFMSREIKKISTKLK